MNRREYITQTTKYLGYTLVTGTVLELLASCENNATNWKPVFFTQEEAITLSAITDTICPKTSSPGANDLGVPSFIDQLVKKLLKQEDQIFFKSGIKEINQIAQQEYIKQFSQLSIDQKENILITLDKKSAPTAMTMWGKPMEEHPAPLSFYRKIKSLTLMAFFTSEKIGKEFLNYDPIPGEFKGCIPYTHQTNWTEI